MTLLSIGKWATNRWALYVCIHPILFFCCFLIHLASNNSEELAHSVESGSAGGQNLKALTVLDRVSAKLTGSMVS